MAFFVVTIRSSVMVALPGLAACILISMLLTEILVHYEVDIWCASSKWAKLNELELY